MKAITMRLVVGRKINTTTSGYCLCNALLPDCITISVITGFIWGCSYATPPDIDRVSLMRGVMGTPIL